MAVAFVWLSGLIVYALAWSCPYPVLAFLGYGLATWLFLSSAVAAWHRAKD